MKILPNLRQICLISLIAILSSCQNNKTFINDREAHVVNFSFKGIDELLQSSLSNFTDFHLHITDMEGKTASYKEFNDIESIPKIEIEQGNYQVLMVANAQPGIFKVPESPLTSQSIISLHPTAASISELCLSHKTLTVTEDENNELELTLKRIVGKINIVIENVPANTDNIQVCINNMFNSVKMDGTYPKDVTTCTFKLTPVSETNSYFAQDIILFPTEGNVNITYTITDKNNKSTVYTQTLNEALNANGTLDITTTLSDIVRQITPRISLKVWDEPIKINNSIIIGKDENNEEESTTNNICFNGLPDDFTPVKLSVVCKNKAGELLPATEALINPEVAIKVPNGSSKLIKATFTDTSNRCFSVYFGQTGTEGVTLQSVITLPKAPTLGSYYAGGIIISQKGNDGYLAYKCTAISTDIWKNTKWGDNFKIGANSTYDAKANYESLITTLKGTDWTIELFPAFNVCRKYRGGGYDDWYFATKTDFTNVYTIYKQVPEKFNELISKYAVTSSPLNLSDGKAYITSTEITSKNMIWSISFTESSLEMKEESSKSSTKYDVCAVRYL